MSPNHSNPVSLPVDEENWSTSGDPDSEFRGKEAQNRLESKLLRKIDLWVTVLVVIYILNYVDRNNAGVARARGLSTDLHLVGEQFATLLSTLYVGYITMQIPSNMFLNYIGKPSLYLPSCMIAWGIISALTGITTSFTGALLVRISLGFVEAAFFPGALFLISKWYKRDEIGLRTAILCCGIIISNAFGALFASGILEDVTYRGTFWSNARQRWLFYIEGALTCFAAICAIFILPDFPTSTRWLTDEERRLALRRMKEDVGASDEEKTETRKRVNGLYTAVTDWKVWLFALAVAAQVVSLSFNAYFPTLSATLGYDPTVTLVLVAPPFIFAMIVAFWLSRPEARAFLPMAGSYVAGIVGFIVAISTMNTAARYLSLLLMAQSYAGFVVMYAWMSNSFPRPPSKRAVCLSLVNGFSQLGNIAGSYVWPSTWGPTYRYSYGICIACSWSAILMSWVFREHLRALNKRLDDEGRARKFRYPLWCCLVVAW